MSARMKYNLSLARRHAVRPSRSFYPATRLMLDGWAPGAVKEHQDHLEQQRWMRRAPKQTRQNLKAGRRGNVSERACHRLRRRTSLTGVEDHRLLAGDGVGLPGQAGLGRVAGAGEIDPCLRDLVLQSQARPTHRRWLCGCAARSGHGMRMRSPSNGSRDAAVDLILVGEDVVVDRRLAFSSFWRAWSWRRPEGVSRKRTSCIFLCGCTFLNSATTSSFLSPKAAVRCSSTSFGSTHFWSALSLRGCC